MDGVVSGLVAIAAGVLGLFTATWVPERGWFGGRRAYRACAIGVLILGVVMIATALVAAVPWTNVVAAVAMAGLAAYMWIRARDIAREEAQAFGALRGVETARFWNYRLGAVFLGAVAIALLVAGAL